MEDIKSEKGLEIRSHSLNEIIGKPPSWILRWGVMLYIALVFVMLLVLWTIKYPDIILTTAEVKLVVDTNNSISYTSRINANIKLFNTGTNEIKKGQTVIIRFYGCSKKESGLVYGRINEISCIPLYDSIRIDIVFADDQETIYRKFGCPDEITCSAQIITDEKRLLDRIINKTIY